MVRGGGVFGLGNPEGRGGAQAVLEIQVEGRGVQKYAFHRGGGGVDFFWTHSTFFSFTYVTKEMVNSSMCHIG